MLERLLLHNKKLTCNKTELATGIFIIIIIIII